MCQQKTNFLWTKMEFCGTFAAVQRLSRRMEKRSKGGAEGIAKQWAAAKIEQ